MYQPYIRGKQFELIGLRELAPAILHPNRAKISPIIEPVKDSSTLKTTLKELANYSINFTVIINPQVGTFNNPESIFEVIRNSIANYNNFQVGIIFHSRIDHSAILEYLQENADIIPSLSIIHNTVFDNIRDILDLYQQLFPVKYNVVNLSNTTRRYYRNFNAETLIELDDYFSSQSKNSDYLGIEDSTFSEEHLHFPEDGFVGFSDFLSIGADYSESGMLPFAVAIHVSYSDIQGRIRVKHFVSDNNDDRSDTAGKFEEALAKLIVWCNTTGYDSIAIQAYRQLHENGHFPGLGTLKKLSLMNHIDLVLKLI